MVIDAAIRALADLLTAPFRWVLLKTLAITLLLLAAVWAVGTRLVASLAAHFASAHPLDYPWYVDAFTWVAGVLSGVLIFAALVFLLASVSALVASFFLDEIAGAVERQHYPADPPGRPVDFWPALGGSIRFMLLTILVNLLALVLLLVPGVNLIAFFVGNGYLLGREFFELAAARLVGIEAARELRRAHGGTAFLGGLVIAGVLTVPLLNLATPLFATAMMVHVAKAALRRSLPRS